MITLDSVRTALAEADPHTAMDRLARAELTVGRTTADVYAELLPVAVAVRHTHGLGRDARAALTGTLDALTGDCDPDQWYPDGPAPTVATAPTATGRDGPVGESGRTRSPVTPAPAAEVPDSAAVTKRVARILKRLESVRLGPPVRTNGGGSLPLSGAEPPPGGTTLRIIFPAGERRGVRLLGGRAVRQPTKGVYLIPQTDLTTLARANIPFAFVGTAED